jgi:hypothetical protein
MPPFQSNDIFDRHVENTKKSHKFNTLIGVCRYENNKTRFFSIFDIYPRRLFYLINQGGKTIDSPLVITNYLFLAAAACNCKYLRGRPEFFKFQQKMQSQKYEITSAGSRLDL